ncbi:hypothetical protein GQ457_17G008340 [Hibiscus cannabinus]
MSRQITSQESLPRAEERKIRKGLRFHHHIFLNIPKNIYLFDIERVKLTKRVNTVHVRDQKHELTPPRNR